MRKRKRITRNGNRGKPTRDHGTIIVSVNYGNKLVFPSQSFLFEEELFFFIYRSAACCFTPKHFAAGERYVD